MRSTTRHHRLPALLILLFFFHINRVFAIYQVPRLGGSRQLLSWFLILVFFFNINRVFAIYPDWWLERGVIVADSAETNDFAPVNQGQASGSRPRLMRN